MKNFMKSVKARVIAGVSLVAGFAGTASAAIPVAASTALTDLQTDATGMIDLIWPVVAAVTVGFILIKLFKRGGNKV